MKIDIDSTARLLAWLENPQPAVFYGQDLRPHATDIARRPLTGCAFLGCQWDASLAQAAANAGCTIFPYISGAPFDAFTPGLYTPAELYDRFDPDAAEASYEQCRDRLIYRSYIDPATKELVPSDVDTVLLRRIHDASISNALSDVLDLKTRLRTVAIMGGHDVGRDQPVFAQIAMLAQQLSQQGFLILTGGGPGLMEAANLGAYTAGMADPGSSLNTALERLAKAPLYNDARWLSVGYRTWTAMGPPVDAVKSRNIGIPTWFYGHEPPNVFATDIAKYFENSVREEGLLAVALGGIVFAEGNAGTVQELFQDACQNYYRTYDKRKSPMILFGSDYWTPAAMVRHRPRDKRKNVYGLLEKLAVEKGFADYLLVSDDIVEVAKFLVDHPPA